MASIKIINFYKFVHLEAVQDLQAQLHEFCASQQLKGTILLSHEGVNAMLAGDAVNIDAFADYILNLGAFNDIVPKISYTESMPFHRLKVVLKPEIVSFGVEGLDPANKVGTYVAPKDWNALLSDPDVVLIDTRNDYEVKIGTFNNAINPNTGTFREFPEKSRALLSPEKHKKVAMFCTGGIRCEKASAFLLEEGFEEVYHLEGGILKYLEEVPESESLWQGECFVFDHRITVDHQLQPGSYHLCYGCKQPLTDDDLASPLYEAEVQCPHCAHAMTEDKRKRCLERKKQIALAAKRQEVHLGASYE